MTRITGWTATNRPTGGRIQPYSTPDSAMEIEELLDQTVVSRSNVSDRQNNPNKKRSQVRL
jgi:hypothetical protein